MAGGQTGKSGVAGKKTERQREGCCSKTDESKCAISTEELISRSDKQMCLFLRKRGGIETQRGREKCERKRER